MSIGESECICSGPRLAAALTEGDTMTEQKTPPPDDPELEPDVPTDPVVETTTTTTTTTTEPPQEDPA